MRLAVVFGAVALGCSQAAKPANFPDLYPCEVAVMQDGGPVAGAQVLLSAEDVKWSIGGVTNEAGVARLYTHGTFPGAPVGSYKVTIVKEVREEVPNPRHQPEVDNEPTIITFKRVLNPAFATAKTTPFEVTVAKGGAARHVFDVGSIAGGKP